MPSSPNHREHPALTIRLQSNRPLLLWSSIWGIPSLLLFLNLVSGCVEDITSRREDMNFIFEWL